MPEPKNTTTNTHFMGFTNVECPFFPCHTGVKEPEKNFNCLTCFCPLIAYECPGAFTVFTDKHGNKRRDCSACNLPHNGIERSWNFIQHWLENPKPWNGEPQTERRMKAAVHVEHPRKPSCPSCGSVDYETGGDMAVCGACRNIWPV